MTLNKTFNYGVCLNNSIILLLFLAYFFSFRSFSDKHRDFRAVHLHGDLTNSFDFFWFFHQKKCMGFTHVSNNPHQVCAFIIWSFDHLIVWSFDLFDSFDPKIYAVSLFCLYIFFTYSFFHVLIFGRRDGGGEGSFFFFIRSEDRRRQQNLGQNGFFFATKQFF